MIQVEAIGNRVSKWGEGPIWWQGKLLYVDIEGHAVVRFDPETASEEVWDVGQRVGAVVPRKDGGLVFAGDKGFWLLDEESGEGKSLVDPEPEMEANRFNDGKCSPDGYFFAGTISLVKKTGDARLYRLGADHECVEAYGPVTNSNGIAWSEDAKTCYYIDTPTKEVLAFDYANGVLRNPRPVISTAHYESSPDGMTIDEDGKLWIAFCHGACVVRFCPKTGKELQKIDLPCLETTACAFGGKNLDILYVTTGIHKSEVEENAGRLFKITGLGIKGVQAFPFAG